MNSRLDALQAAVLLPKLKALADYEIDARQVIAKRYDAAFAGKFITPFIPEGAVSAYAQYALLAENSTARDKIIARLNEKQIPNMVYYPTPQHALPVFQKMSHYGERFQNAAAYCANTFSIPIYPYLDVKDQSKVICAILEEC